MGTQVELMEDLCERAGVLGRRREVLMLLAGGMSPAEVGAELGAAVWTVYAQKHEGWRRIAAARQQRDELELLRFLLYEAMPGPTVSSPQPALYRALPGGGGERMRLHAGPLVTIEDLLAGRTD